MVQYGTGTGTIGAKLRPGFVDPFFVGLGTNCSNSDASEWLHDVDGFSVQQASFRPQ